MVKKKSKWLKFIIRDKSDKSPICGVRYDEEKQEFLIGGPKTKEDERKRLIILLDLSLEELKKEVKEDGFRSRLKIRVNKKMWREFRQRASMLYIFEEVKSFKRLTG